MKKWWLILTLVLTLCACAASAEISGDWEYYPLEDGTVEIYGYGGLAEELVIPTEIDGSKVSRLGDVCFAEHPTLRRVTIPDEITQIGRNPFFGCPALEEIVVSIDHPTLATIDGVLFYKPEKKLVSYPFTRLDMSYAVPEGILAIGGDAFWGSKLTEITLPSTLTTLEDMAFRSCGVLDGVLLPESVQYVGADAFNSCAALRSVNLPAGLEAIYDGTFVGCMSLTSIDISESVLSIGNNAFSGCQGIAEFDLPDNLAALGHGAFNACHAMARIVLPDSLKLVYGNPFTSCSGLTDIVVSIDHPTLATIDGVLFRKSDKTLVCYPSGLTASAYTVPEGIQVIGKAAFQNNFKLEEITLPSTLTEIGMEAFSSCHLIRKIVIPDGVTKIGLWAFLCAQQLAEATVPASVTEIGQDAFNSEYCPITIHTWRGSYAAQWAKENGIAYDYADALDWLTN